MLSTDIGTDIDDAFCLLSMLNAGIAPEVVYTTNGNVLLRSFVASHIVSLFGADTEIAMGEASSFNGGVQPFDYDVESNVDDSFIDQEKSDKSSQMVYKKPSELEIIEDGVGDMARRLRNHQYVIFSIAPLTNVARLITRYPEVVKNIKCLYVMGCRLFDKGTHLEHNIKYDPEAAKIVFESDISIIVVPGDVCARYRMPVDFLEKLSSPAGLYVKKMALSYLALITFSEYRLLKGGEHVSEALKLEGMYAEIAEIDDLDQKSEHLKKMNTYPKILEDNFCAMYEPNRYFEVLAEVAKHIENSKGYYRFAEYISNALREIVPKNFSASDAYIPFCYLYPESIKIERSTVVLAGSFGESYLSDGSKHQIVSEIDALKFERFLRDKLQ
jgi:inosine-uridine nucleoside N-ribohydrolase